MYAFIFRNTHSSVCKITLRRDFLTLLRRCVRSGFGCSAFRTARPGRRRTALFAGRCLRRRHIAAEASATAEERIFLAEFVCEHVRNIPHFNSIFPARSSFYHLLSPKGGAKSVRRAPSSDRTAVLTERAQNTALFCTPAPGAQTAVRSDSSSGAMRKCCALRATMILIPFTQF